MFCRPSCLSKHSSSYHSQREMVGVLVYLTWFFLSSFGLHVLCKHEYHFSWLLILGDHVWLVVKSLLFQSGVYLACLDLMCIFIFYFQRFNLSLLKRFFLFLLYGAHRELSTYIPLVSFSMLAWIFGIFLTYSFYPSSHHAEIR